MNWYAKQVRYNRRIVIVLFAILLHQDKALHIIIKFEKIITKFKNQNKGKPALIIWVFIQNCKKNSILLFRHVQN